MTIEQLEKEVKRLTDVKNDYRRRCWSEYMRRLRAEAGLHAVRDLIADSAGVAGLHMNAERKEYVAPSVGRLVQPVEEPE